MKFLSRSAGRSAGIVIACAVAIAGCSDSPTATTETITPGTLSVRWTTPLAMEGAVRLTLSGPDIGEIRIAQSDAIVFVRGSGSSRQIAVLGDARPGVLLHFDVPDASRTDLYEATLVEVADTDGVLREDLDDYGIVVVR